MEKIKEIIRFHLIKLIKFLRTKLILNQYQNLLRSDYMNLSKIKLKSSIFMNKKFYRLHWLEKMIKIKRVSNLNLRVSN